jgi:hypothetical protein
MTAKDRRRTTVAANPHGANYLRSGGSTECMTALYLPHWLIAGALSADCVAAIT